MVNWELDVFFNQTQTELVKFEKRAESIFFGFIHSFTHVITDKFSLLFVTTLTHMT